MKKWRDKTVSEVLENGFISLSSGRRRRFSQATDWINSRYAEDDSSESGLIWQANNLRESISRQAMNFPVQGGAHEVFEPAQIRVAKRFKKEGIKARLMLSIHDGLVGECLKKDAKAVSQILSEEMPVTFNRGNKDELTLDIDKDFYKWEWYGEKVKI
jgi:DNA polymerase-1